MSNQSNTSNDKPRTVQDIIREIEQKSEGGGYIYRGERKCNPKVSSKLYRDFEIETGNFDIELVQKEMLAGAKKHTGDLPHDSRVDVMAPPNVIAALTEEAIDFEILTEIQHYGGKTNLIDFTTDYFIALFFACDGRYDEDGRVILQKVDEIRGMDMIEHPRNPRHRVVVQKSVFIRPSRGFIEPDENDIVTIPANLKQPLLQHLRDYHGIFTEVIYNDIHGFIRNQNIHGDAYTHFYRGFACGNRGDRASKPEEKQQEYEESIKHYTEAIKLKPDLADAYNNRGNAYSKKGEVDNAISDYNTAIKLNPDDATAYNNRGSAYADKGEVDNAISDYNTAIKLKHDLADAYNGRGNAYFDKGELDNAIRDYTKAIELKPDLSKAYKNRGDAYQRKSDFDNAINDYNTAIQLQPDDAGGYNNRGVAYAQKSDFGFAIQDFTKAIQLKPDFPEAYYNRGEAWLHLQEWEKVKSDLITAKDMGVDIIAAFHNDYASVEDFEQKTGIQLPADIAALLTPSQA